MNEDEEVDVSTIPELAHLLVEYRARGKTPDEIAAETGIPTADVKKRIQEYLESNYGTETVAMQRMLMLNRLERIVNAIWDQVMDGDLATEGKQVKNLIDLLKQLTELLDLNKDRVRDELVQLTKAQTEMVYTIMAGMRVEIFRSLMEAVQAVPTTGTPEEYRATLRTRIDAGFADWFAAAAESAQQEATATLVTVGGEAADKGTYANERIAE